MAVSPFDGANRIRFKGSPDFRLTIRFLTVRLNYHANENQKSAIANVPDSQPPRGSPENIQIVNYSSRF